MKVAILGAGMSGLGAAHALKNHDVTLWDKGVSVGGRIGTRRLEENGQTIYFDHGAQNIKSANRVLDLDLQRLGFNQRVEIASPICLRDGATVLPADAQANAEPKWSCVQGMRNLPRFLAKGFDIRLKTRVSRLEKQGDNWVLRDETNRVLDVAERVIVTFPAPQAADLLEQSDQPNASEELNARRIELLRSVRYSRCISVLLRYEVASDENAPYALLSKERDVPLLWLARENAKGFAPKGSTAFVAQLSDAASRDLWDENDEEIVRQIAHWIAEVDARFTHPSWSFVKRWRYSQPQNPIAFEDVNSIENRVLICGDGLSKARVADAWESGIRAAQLLLQSA